MDETANISVISSRDFSYDVANKIFTAKSSVLGSKVDLFTILDTDGNRGFIFDFDSCRMVMHLWEILDKSTGWIFHPVEYDHTPIAVFISNN